MTKYNFIWGNVVGQCMPEDDRKKLYKLRLQNAQRRLNLEPGNDIEHARVLAINALLKVLKKNEKLSDPKEALSALCCQIIAERSCGAGKMHIYVPSGTLRRLPLVSPDCNNLRIFVEMKLCGCGHKIVIEINLAETTDFRSLLTTSIKTPRGLDILYFHGLSLAGSQSAQSICRLLTATQLDVNIITMYAHEASTISINDFALTPWRGSVMRYTEEHLGFGY